MVLEPAVSDLADLVTSMFVNDWPRTEDERRQWFHDLGLTETGSASAHVQMKPEYHLNGMSTSLSGFVTGVCSMFRNEFLGLSLFAYSSNLPDGVSALTALPELAAKFDAALGPRAEQWGTSSEPALLWRQGALHLEMYCIQQPHSQIMLSLGHTARSEALEATPNRSNQHRS